MSYWEEKSPVEYNVFWDIQFNGSDYPSSTKVGLARDFFNSVPENKWEVHKRGGMVWQDREADIGCFSDYYAYLVGNPGEYNFYLLTVYVAETR